MHRITQKITIIRVINMRFPILAKLALSVSCVVYSSIAMANEVKVKNVREQVYVITGSGGNIGLLNANKGLLLIDDKFAPMAEAIEAAMKSVSDKKLKYVVNTHYHGDHTGGNKHFSKLAPIFAHHNVRNRLANKAEADNDSLPVVTYETGLTIHAAPEQVELTHLPSGHTDGDSIVYFKHANVLHTGDLFFQGRFPYVDLKAGGTVEGYLANVKYMIDNFPDDVIIIPGHGVVTDKAELKKFATMIAESIAYVKWQRTKGLGDEEIVARGVLEKFKSYHWRFITEEKWLKTLVAEFK